MKIGEIFIRDVISHPQPSGMIYCRGLNKMGYNPYYLPYENNISLDQIDYNYDSSKTTILIDYTNILHNPNHIKELKYFKLQNPNSKIFLSAYLPYNNEKGKGIIEEWKAYQGLVDKVFNTVFSFPYAEELFNNVGLDYLNLPFSFDDAYSIPNESTSYDYDISFIGSTIEGDRYLNIWYNPLSSNNNYKTFFSGFNNYPTTPFEQTYKIYNTSKINLNPHYSHQFGEDKGYGSIFDFNARTFALAGMGCFQLSNHPYYKEIFGNDIPIFNKNNFIDLINYYLKNDDERNKISSKMQQIIFDKHTTECRIKTLLEL
jgi:hypothetical protein